MSQMLTRVVQTLRGYEEALAVWILERDGYEHRVILNHPEHLRRAKKYVAVGFFSGMKTGARQNTLPLIQAADDALVNEFKTFDGLFSYSTLQLDAERYANMALFRDVASMDSWYTNPIHQEAIQTLAPRHYEYIRLHVATVQKKRDAMPVLHIDVTKYYDFTEDNVWLAVRDGCTRNPNPSP